jgi:hypothetical protein
MMAKVHREIMKSQKANSFARLLRGFDRAVGNMGLFNESLRPEALIQLAQRRTRLREFGEWSFHEPLTVLLRAYKEESDLTTLGRFAVRWDIVRFLSNLLRLCEEEKKAPEILNEQISAPIFILGLPRSGTTFLHNLMALDPGNLAPRAWQTIYPYPLRRRELTNRDPRPRMVARHFARFLRIAPELPSLHPLEAEGAQECIEITGQVIRSMRFDTTHYVPSYERWLDAAGHLEAYQFHKRFLQHLQHQNGPGQWILKSPDHIFALDALLQVYPDARLVLLHRDPLHVLASVAKLTEILREPFARKVDRQQIGRQVSKRWSLGSRLLIETSMRLRESTRRIVNLRYSSLVRDPLATLKAVYCHFNLVLRPQAQARINHFLANRPNGGHGQNTYRIEDYGLDRENEIRRYRDYKLHFQIGCES